MQGYPKRKRAIEEDKGVSVTEAAIFVPEAVRLRLVDGREQEACLAAPFEGFALNGVLVDKALMLLLTSFH